MLSGPTSEHGAKTVNDAGNSRGALSSSCCRCCIYCRFPNIGALIICNTILGAPCYNCDIMGLKTLF